jgi:DNA polymerase-3 subunit epsilon
MRREHGYVFFDLETTGLLFPIPGSSTLHREDQDEIIQIAAVATGPAPEFKEKETFERKMLPSENGLKRLERTREMAPQLGPFDTAKWAAAASPRVRVYDDLERFLTKYACIEKTSKTKGTKYVVAHMAGHNADRFDLPFLFASFKKSKVFLPAHGRALDTMHMVSTLEMLNDKLIDSYHLEDLCKMFGVKLENAHDALADVRATVALARALMQFFSE